MEINENGFNILISTLPDIISHKKKLYQSVVNLKEELREKEDELNKVEKYLYANCKHQWVTDSIDSMKNYKLGQIIKYCEICELSG
tara:strand:+ start:12988 stop:13245 length:258 start_codon:yes stop_codon:yes gene_type:complete